MTTKTRPTTRYLGLAARCAIGVTVLVVASACGSSGSGDSGTSAASTSTSSSAAPSGGDMSSMPGMSASASTGTSGSTAAGNAVTVDIKNFTFTPMDVTVAVGTTVTWKFEDSAAHTVKANDGSFTSPSMKDGQTFSYTFTKAGSYPYICSIHQYMTATVTVK